MPLLRILVFEDSYDIESLLASGGVDLSGVVVKQLWNSSEALNHIAEFQPDVLLLDHFMPPDRGLEVLRSLNRAVADGLLERPRLVVGISSARFANREMVAEGADFAYPKFALPDNFEELRNNL